jgi:lipoyl(octanoyl) transferase
VDDNCLDVFEIDGKADYAEAWALQRQVHQEVAQGRRNDTLLLLEHSPTYTVGRRGTWHNLKLSAAELSSRGYALYHSDRGGDITYHGPGQLVGYPIILLSRHALEVRPFVSLIESCLVAVLARRGIEAHVDPQYPGVWCAQENLGEQAMRPIDMDLGEQAKRPMDKKIGAIGVRVAQGVSMHGFALNVTTKLEDFSHIVPCGIIERGVCSVSSLLGGQPDDVIAQYRSAIARDFAARLGLRPQWPTEKLQPQAELVAAIRAEQHG